jgi:hypothetical protein
MTDSDWVHLDTVERRVLERIGNAVRIHEIHFVPLSLLNIGVYVFYPTDNEREEYARSGSATVQRVIEEELDRVGRGPRDGAQLRFEFDSHENVQKNYRGKYYLRLL